MKYWDEMIIEANHKMQFSRAIHEAQATAPIFTQETCNQAIMNGELVYQDIIFKFSERIVGKKIKIQLPHCLELVPQGLISGKMKHVQQHMYSDDTSDIYFLYHELAYELEEDRLEWFMNTFFEQLKTGKPQFKVLNQSLLAEHDMPIGRFEALVPHNGMLMYQIGFIGCFAGSPVVGSFVVLPQYAELWQPLGKALIDTVQYNSM